MCFSATANFVGSAVLGTVGVVTLKKVTHRREFFFGATEIFLGRRAWGRGRRHTEEGETQTRIAFRGAALAIRDSSVHRGIRLAGIGWHSLAHGNAQHGCGVHAVCTGTSPLPDASERAAV